jgi:hypothetical protein
MIAIGIDWLERHFHGSPPSRCRSQSGPWGNVTAFRFIVNRSSVSRKRLFRIDDNQVVSYRAARCRSGPGASDHGVWPVDSGGQLE